MSEVATAETAPRLRWGVIGCGVIANQMAQTLALEGRAIDGVANRTRDKADAFAEKYGVGRVYDSIDDLIASPDIDAIYLTTPHNTHITYLRKALAAGKHVLCEKAITLNSDELDEARTIAAANGVVLMTQTGFPSLIVSESDLLFGLSITAALTLQGQPSPVVWKPVLRSLT